MVRALLNCVVSALAYSGSICGCDRQRHGGGCGKGRDAEAVVPARMFESLLPCTYLIDGEKSPHQNQHHHQYACTSSTAVSLLLLVRLICRDVLLLLLVRHI